MTDLFVARALHVIGVVIWIGGVWMATLVILPAVRRGDFGEDWLAAFEAVEHRFVRHARTAVLLVGLSGYYMLERYDLWGRFADLSYWWMHAMVVVWTVFAFILFIGEPFVLHRYFPIWAGRDRERAFALLHRMHVVLLVLSVITILGAVAGAHGWYPQ